MNKIIKRVVSMVTMVTILTANLGVLSTYAATSDDDEVATGILLYGTTSFQWTYPGGGVSVYHFDSRTSLTDNAPGSWTLHSGIHLDYWASGALISSNYVSGSSNDTPVIAPVQGASIGTYAKAFSSHEVRGAYSGSVYTASEKKYI